MRETCLMCVSKHLAQAIVLTIESRTGYPTHLWLAVGHLAEAEAECVSQYHCFANKIRTVRMALSGQEGTIKDTDLMDLLEQARDIAEGINEESDESRQGKLWGNSMLLATPKSDGAIGIVPVFQTKEEVATTRPKEFGDNQVSW